MTGRSSLLSNGRFRGNTPEPERNPAEERGFSLVEVMIAVFIVGVLAAIAVPTFLAYTRKNMEAIAIQDINVIASRLAAYAWEGALPDDLNTINFGNTLPLVDPWGNPYRYLKLQGAPGNLPQARRDHGLVPINSDFDLYSMGPDGQSNKPLTSQISRDDIIRANDGAFVGKASVYDP